MKTLATILAVGLSTATTFALAGPTPMSDEQLDAVTGGLVDVIVVDVVDVNNVANRNQVQVAIPVNAAAAVAILGASAAEATQPGNITQRRRP